MEAKIKYYSRDAAAAAASAAALADYDDYDADGYGGGGCGDELSLRLPEVPSGVAS